MGVSRKSRPSGDDEREYAWEAAVHGVDFQAVWREFLAETVVAVPGGEEDSWEASGEDEETLNKRAAKQAAQDLKSADFEVRWAACRDLAKLQRAAAPYMEQLAELVATEQEFDVKRVARKTLQALRKADEEGWPTAPVRPERMEADVGELEAAGIPLQRLRSIEVARRLLQKLRKLQRLDLATLQHEYLRLGVPLEPNMGKEQLLERLSAAALWSELDLEELEKECQKRKIAAVEGKNCEELAVMLLHDTCERAWEAVQGVSARRLGSFEAAASIIHQQALLEPLSDSALQRNFLDRGLLLEPNAPRAELLRRLRLVLLWEALPLEELLPNAVSRQAAIEQLMMQSCESAFAARGIPLARLGSMRTAVRLSEMFVRLEAMGEEELAHECERLGITARPAERLRCVQLMALWAMLPMAELTREWAQRSDWLQQRGLAAASLSSGSDPQRKHLQELLQLSLCVEAWEAMGLPLRRCGTLRGAARLAENMERLEAMGYAELVAEAERLGVPGLDLASLKRVVLWTEFSVLELQKECGALGISIAGNWEQLLESLKHYAREKWAPTRVKRLRVLGLSAGADAEDVRRAFKQLALKHHPDKNPGRMQEEAARAFREVREAYDALCKEMAGLERS